MYPAWGSRLAPGDAQRIAAELQSQAERYGVEPWLVMFAWLLKHPAGILPIVGSTTPARIAAAPRALALDYRREDWYRLLEIWALADTLVVDEEGIYDPSQYNDRLLLGFKGTMSEAELHVLKGRLHGGIRAKAERGELRVPLAVGFVYDATDKVIIDPDKQVQKSIHLFFDTFNQVGSASGTVKYFRRNGLKFPRKLLQGPNKGDVVWWDLVFARADRLEKESKRILQEASVIEESFCYDILNKISEIKDNIDRNLSGLERFDFIKTKAIQPYLEYIFYSTIRLHTFIVCPFLGATTAKPSFLKSSANARV